MRRKIVVAVLTGLLSGFAAVPAVAAEHQSTKVRRAIHPM